MDFNPQQVFGDGISKAIDEAKGELPLSSTALENQKRQLFESAGNALASEFNELTAGVRAVVNQQSPFPTKKVMTFFLLDRAGNLVQPTDGSFQPGYLFNMAVNPSSFNVTMPPKSIVPTRTMGGWVVQHWYPEIGTIQVDGIIGNLLQAYNTDIKKTPNWQAFTKLIKVYQNNGVPYQSGTVKRNQAQFNPTAVCVYDRVTYSGYFENFTLQEDETNPYTRKYSFTFKFLDMVETLDIVEKTRRALTGGINNFLGGNNGILTPTATTINNLLK